MRRPDIHSSRGFTIVEVIVVVVVLFLIGLAIWGFSGAGTASVTQTTSGTFTQADLGTAHYITNGGSQTFIYTVTRQRSDGAQILPNGVTMTFAVTGGMTVAPATATTDDTGLINVVVTAPANGQGAGQLTATTGGATPGAQDTINIEYGP